jgi:hypothetical protein
MKKRIIITAMLIIMALVVIAATPLSTKQSAWQLRGTVTAGITTPGVTARDKASVEALAGIFIEVFPADNAIIIRGSGATDNSDNIYDVLFMASGDDHYNRVATLTFTTGTQTSPVSGEEFSDLITVADEKWHSEMKNASAADDYIGELAVDMWGCGRIALIPTTIVTSSSIWYRGV